MEINLDVLGTQRVESTVQRKKMKLSSNASQMVFKLFTKNVYSNPIGTVVREITSNCFDSHIEAGVNAPVLIKKTYDKSTETNYISFIDYGVGMSPDRVENIYGVYFESTKRTGNDQIGGFGIGGKTPLAYKRQTGEGEGEYDNSFFVITNHEGTKYYYTVFEGPESPEFTLFHSEKTDERNGTEVRIPVLNRDIIKFEDEIIRQLFYFDGVVFEGFSEKINNDYQIVKGKNFLYRPNCFDQRIHVCLGSVYYPINYNVLGLNPYNHQIPVAINIPIGKIGVTVSREQLDYSEGTIKYLKNGIDEVKAELITMLEKQYENITTLEDYFNNNFGNLQLLKGEQLDLKRFISPKNINLSNFKYSNKFNKIPSDSIMMKLFFKISTYGKKEPRNSWRNDGANVLRKEYVGLINVSQHAEGTANCNVYHADKGEIEIKRVKQSYLKYLHTRYYIITPRDLYSERIFKYLCEHFNFHPATHDEFLKSKTFKWILKAQKDYYDIVQKYIQHYNDVEIDENFSSTYGKRKLSVDVLKRTIPVQYIGSYKERTRIELLHNFKGKIFYSNIDDEVITIKAHRLFTNFFNINHIGNYYSLTNNNTKGKVMFVTVSNSNVRFLKGLHNAIPSKDFYKELMYRKEDTIKRVVQLKDVYESYNQISDFYFSNAFLDTYPKFSETIKNIINCINDINTIYYNIVEDNISFFQSHIDLNFIKLNKEDKKIKDAIDKLKLINDINKDVLSFLPYSNYDYIFTDEKKKLFRETLKKVLTI